MKHKLVFFFILTFFPSCITYYVNDIYLNGEWTDFIEQKGAIYFEGNSVIIRFTADSFFYKNERWNDAFVRGDTCPAGSGNEYASGKFLIKQDLLYLNGYWIDKRYKIVKNNGCYNNGKLELTYKYEILEKKKFQLYLLDSTDNFKTGVKKNLILYKE